MTQQTLRKLLWSAYAIKDTQLRQLYVGFLQGLKTQ